MLSKKKWTVDDYHRIIALGGLDDKAVELINGNIIERLPEGISHSFRSDEAGEYLMGLLGTQAKVRQAKPVTIPDSNSEPEPDIAIVQRLGSDYLTHHPYPENIYWLIEYSDFSLDKDLEVKTKLFSKARILEYWVVNLRSLELIVMRSPTQDGYELQEIWHQDFISPLSFPNVVVEVGRLLNR